MSVYGVQMVFLVLVIKGLKWFFIHDKLNYLQYKLCGR